MKDLKKNGQGDTWVKKIAPDLNQSRSDITIPVTLQYGTTDINLNL